MTATSVPRGGLRPERVLAAIGHDRLGDLVIMIVEGDIEPRRPARRTGVEGVEDDVPPGAVEALDEGPGGIIDDGALALLADALEHGVKDIGLARSRRAAQQDMLGLIGCGDRDPAHAQASLCHAPQAPPQLSDRGEARPAQELVGAQPSSRDSEIIPGGEQHDDDENGGAAANQLDAVEKLAARVPGDPGSQQFVGPHPISPSAGRGEQDGAGGTAHHVKLEPGFRHLAEQDPGRLMQHLIDQPEGEQGPEDEPGKRGLFEDLGGHPHIVDGRLTTPRPGPQRVVAEDAHGARPSFPKEVGRIPLAASSSGSSSPRSRSIAREAASARSTMPPDCCAAISASSA